jgi:thiol-disulfide isomerase/thioredoxin
METPPDATSMLNSLKEKLPPPMYLAGGMVLLALFIAFAVIFYRYKMKQTTEEEEDDDGEKTCEIFYFYTTWCPICKKVRPQWDKFASQWNGKTRDGTTIVCNEVDCDQNEALANKYQIKAYPTVICVMNGKKTELEANPTAETLNHFLDSIFS